MRDLAVTRECKLDISTFSDTAQNSFFEFVSSIKNGVLLIFALCFSCDHHVLFITLSAIITIDQEFQALNKRVIRMHRSGIVPPSDG
jgi:hypothetical protein